MTAFQWNPWLRTTRRKINRHFTDWLFQWPMGKKKQDDDKRSVRLSIKGVLRLFCLLIESFWQSHKSCAHDLDFELLKTMFLMNSVLFCNLHIVYCMLHLAFLKKIEMKFSLNDSRDFCVVTDVTDEILCVHAPAQYYIPTCERDTRKPHLNDFPGTKQSYFPLSRALSYAKNHNDNETMQG